MPRLLLFLLVGLAIFLGLRSCSKPPALPPAVERVERIAEPAEAELLRIEQEGVRALLDRDGSVVRLDSGKGALLAGIPASRRPFLLGVRLKNGALGRLKADRWESRVIDAGREFLWSDGAFQVTKSVTVAPGGGSLLVTIRAEGLPADIAAFEVSGVAGVPFGEGASLDRCGLVLAAAGTPAFTAFDELVRIQESERRNQIHRLAAGEEVSGGDYHYRFETPGPAPLPFAGILGRDGFVGFRDLAGVRALQAEAFRVVREGREESDIELWATLAVTEAAATGRFSLHWMTVPQLFAAVPALEKVSALTRQEPSLHVLENDTLRYVFTDRGACVVKAYLKGFAREVGQPLDESGWIPILREEVRPRDRVLLLEVRNRERVGGDPASDPWTVEPFADARGARGLRFVLETPTAWRFVKSVTLPAEGRYDLSVAIEVHRPDGSADDRLQYSLTGPSGCYVEDIHRGISAGDVETGIRLERPGGDDETSAMEEISGKAMDQSYGEESRRGLLHALAVRGAYFVGALATPLARDREGRYLGSVTQATIEEVELTREVARPDGTRTRRTLRAGITSFVDLSAGKSAETFLLYAGPNAVDQLRPLGLQETVDFGMFGLIGRGLMWLMKFFAGLFGSLGAGIILMTMIVRGLLAPISYKTQLGMQRYSRRIQKIKPILDDLTKKYGDNKQKLNTERLRVMREHKVGFPAGCLTIFLQIPIWFALFQGLRVEFSLRHQAFLWAADLSMPDRLLPLPLWPHWFNLFPLLMLVLWVWQQKVTPTPASDDPQVRMQMRMMRFMPYMFFVFLYNYAAALAVYMCVSSVWGIVEGKLVRKAIARQPD
ncbi:MAG: YidC/Oxa1 family insertase periplasmic-domain containing protein [Planctomycetaceae bacterium]